MVIQKIVVSLIYNIKAITMTTIQDLKDNREQVIEYFNENGGQPQFLKAYMEDIKWTVECGVNDSIEELCSQFLTPERQGRTVKKKNIDKWFENMSVENQDRYYTTQTKSLRK